MSTLGLYLLFQYFHSAVAAVNISTSKIQTNTGPRFLNKTEVFENVSVRRYEKGHTEHKLISDEISDKQS